MPGVGRAVRRGLRRRLTKRGPHAGDRALGRREVVEFVWNGRYPKKKQWCLENLPFRHDFVLYLDADEEVTEPSSTRSPDSPRAASAGRATSSAMTMFFSGRRLRHGLRVYKLVLFDRHRARYLELRRPRCRAHVGGRGPLPADDRRTRRDSAGTNAPSGPRRPLPLLRAPQPLLGLGSRSSLARRHRTGRRDADGSAFPTEAGFREDAVSASRDLRLLVPPGRWVSRRPRRLPLRRVPGLLLLADRAEDERAKSTEQSR